MIYKEHNIWACLKCPKLSRAHSCCYYHSYIHCIHSLLIILYVRYIIRCEHMVSRWHCQNQISGQWKRCTCHICHKLPKLRSTHAACYNCPLSYFAFVLACLLGALCLCLLLWAIFRPVARCNTSTCLSHSVFVLSCLLGALCLCLLLWAIFRPVARYNTSTCSFILLFIMH